MVKRTMEMYECDLCGDEGDRYTVIFPEGALAMDRCERHAAKLLKLRDEKGIWTSQQARQPKSSFKLSTPDDIKRQQQGN